MAPVASRNGYGRLGSTRLALEASPHRGIARWPAKTGRDGVRGMVDDEPRGNRGGGKTVKQEIWPVAWTIGYEGGGVEEARESGGNAGRLSGDSSFSKLGWVKGKSKGAEALRQGEPVACSARATFKAQGRE
jgi:hypothetical protein